MQVWECVVKWLENSGTMMAERQNRFERKGSRWQYQMYFLCQCVMMASYLTGMAGLMSALEQSLRVTLPRALCDELLESLRASEMLSSSTLKRHRLTLHCAFMLLLRQRHSYIDDEYVTYHTMDSSPQGGRDYLCSCMLRVRVTDLIEAMDKVEWMQCLWRNYTPSLNIPSVDAELMIAHLLWLHELLKFEPLTPVTIGSGRAGLVNKMHAWLHVLRLTQDTWMGTVMDVNLAVCFTTDWGTEAKFATHRACALKEYFPWMDEAVEAAAFRFEDIDGSDGDDEMPEDPQPFAFHGPDGDGIHEDDAASEGPPGLGDTDYEEDSDSEVDSEADFNWHFDHFMENDAFESDSDDAQPGLAYEPAELDPFSPPYTSAPPSPSLPADAEPQPETPLAPPPEFSNTAALQFADDGLSGDVIADAKALMLNPGMSLHTPGLLHILHHACEYMANAIPGFKEFKKKVGQVCDLLRRTYSRERLLTQCFGQEPLKSLRANFDGFRANIHHGRFGDIIDAAQELNCREVVLRAGWDVKKYNYGKEVPAKKDDNSWRIGLADVNDAITSDDFWAHIKIMLVIGETAQALFAWVLSCDCHGDNKIYKEFLQRMGAPSELWTKACPMCGRRAPAMAMGEFRELLSEVWSVTDAEVILMTTGLSREQRQRILDACRAAREAFVTYLGMKIAVYEEFPLVLAALAHNDQDKARRLAFRMADTYDSMSPAEKKLQHHLVRAILDHDGVVRAQLDQFVLRKQIGPHLMVHMARLRFIVIVENLVEGQHAKIARSLAGKGNHGPVHVAFKYHFPLLQSMLRDGPTMLQLVETMDKVNRPTQCVDVLGFRRHPVIVAAEQSVPHTAIRKGTSEGWLDKRYTKEYIRVSYLNT